MLNQGSATPGQHLLGLAQALEAVHSADLDPVAGIIAGQYEAAGLPAQAIAYYDRAAATARRIYAHGEALVALEKAIALQDALPDAARCGLVAHLHEEMGDLRELLAAKESSIAFDILGDMQELHDSVVTLFKGQETLQFGGEEERGILSNFPEDKQTAETALLFLQLTRTHGHLQAGKRIAGLPPPV